MKELSWKENQGFQNISIEDSRVNGIVDLTQGLKIFENYITEP